MLKNIFTILTLGLVLLSCKNSQKNLTENQTISFVTEMNRIIEENGVDQAMGWFQSNKELDKYTYNESELNQLGYNLLYKQKKLEDAIKIFELTTIKFPKSSNAYDSFAEAYLANGEYDLSIENYRKSIELGNSVKFHQLGFLSSKPYTKTVIPNDTTKLFVAEGSWENDIAFVFEQGGPDIDLQINTKDALHLIPNADNLLKIYPVQSQILNPYLLITNPILTAEQSAAENEISVEILSRTINYLKKKGKKVFLIGHSYGSSVCLEYLASKKNVADKIVIMGLDLNEDISSWNQLQTGEYIRWENGKIQYQKRSLAGFLKIFP